MKPKVLVASSSFGSVSQAPLDSLRDRFDVVTNPFGRRLTEAEIAEVAAGCYGIVSGLEPLTRSVLTALPELRCISRVGSGVDNVDLDAARERGIYVVTTPTAPVTAVAELTLGLALDLLRGVSRQDRRLRGGVWKREPGWLLKGRTVGVVGLGNIGRAVARLMGAVGARVLGHDLEPDLEWAQENGVTMLPLDELLRDSSLVTLHVSRRPDERPLIGSAELALLGSDGFLLNLSRGQSVDEEALVEALRAGGVAGAALDVFWAEPYRGPLGTLDNVILTPHIGSATYETISQMEQEAVWNLIERFERPSDDDEDA